MTDHPQEALPPHPESQVMTWSELEREAIRAYAEAAVARERERCEQACATQYLAGPARPEDYAHDQAVDDCIAAIRKGP